MLGQWFEALGLFGQICLCFAVPSSIVLLVQIVLSLLGLSDGGMDLADGADGELPDLPDDLEDFSPGDVDLGGFHILTLRTVMAFFVSFGWMGVSLANNALAPWAQMLISIGFGLAMMALVAFLMWGVYRLQADGTAQNVNALGSSGTVYLTVPAERVGHGKVNVMLQGAYVERDAVTDEKAPLSYGTEIVVVGVSGENTLVVAKK